MRRQDCQLTTPLVSVIIPCYNQGCWLSNAIKSVFKQTYKNVEVILVNDGSTDNIKEIAAMRARAHPIKYIEIPHQGTSIAINVGVSMCKADYFLRLDADDILKPIYIEKTLKELLKDEKIGFVYTIAEYFGYKRGFSKIRNFNKYTILCYNYVHGSALIRKRAFETVGGFDPELPAHEDWDLWIRLASKDWKGKAIFEPLMLYRKHDPNIYLSRNNLRNRLHAIKLIKRKHFKVRLARFLLFLYDMFNRHI